MELNIFLVIFPPGSLIDLAILSVIFILQFYFLLSQFSDLNSLFEFQGELFLFDRLGKHYKAVKN